VPEVTPDRWGEKLPRKLGLFSAIAVLAGTTIGSGIFRVPATVATDLQDPGPVLVAWVLGGVISLCGALSVAELAAALPRSGGIFAYLLEGFGPLPAFLFGWAEMTVIRASALAGIATIFAEYLGYFVPLSASGSHAVAAVAIVGVALLNYVGVSKAAALMNLMTLAKYGALAALAALAFVAGSGSISHFEPLCSATCDWSLLGAALIPILYTYDGWGNLSFVSGEVRSPQRTLPLALILGTVAVLAVYVVINVAYIYLVPLREMAGSKLIAATAAGRIPLFGGAGAAVISAVVVVSTLSALNGSLMTGPRIVFGMADRGLFFRTVARISPRFETPSVAIGIAAVTGVIYVLGNDFAQLTDKFILGIWPFYVLAVAAVFVLRRRQPDLARPYRCWGYPVVPAVFIVASIGMTAAALWAHPVDTAVTFGILLTGIPAYYGWTSLKRRTAAKADTCVPDFPHG